VCGGDGADVLKGGPGADRLYGQREAWHSDRGGTYFEPDLLQGGPGDDLLDVGGDGRRVDWGTHGTIDFLGSPAAVTVDLTAGTATGEGHDTIVARAQGCEPGCLGLAVLGSVHDDVLLGSASGDLLVGRAGEDRIEGLGGDDELRTEDEDGEGVDDDTAAGGPGDDYVISSAGEDTISGDAGNDYVWATGSAPAQVFGGAGDDRLFAPLSRRPGFVVDAGTGDNDEAQIEGPRKAPGAGGRPTEALVTMADGQVVANEVAWGTLAGVEVLTLGANVGWEYHGTDAAELIYVVGTWLHAFMYGGDDEVWATTGPDEIDGGDGTDEVHAGRGRDTCLNTERPRGCEVVSPSLRR
jgi:hypothetical protein